MTCVLIGSQTAQRRWVRYELPRSFVDGRGIFGIAIHWITNLEGQAATAGGNTLAHLGGETGDGILKFKEFDGASWVWSSDVRSMPARNIAFLLGGWTNFFFSDLFPSYDWVGNDG